MLGRLAGLAAACALAGVLAAAVSPVRAEPLRVDYELYASGLNAMSFSALVDVRASGYDIQLQGETKGMVGVLFAFEMEARSTGAVEQGRLLPDRYRTANRIRSRALRWVHMDYGAAGLERVRGRPTPAEDDRDAVERAARDATIDPVTGVFAILLEAMDGCSASVEVFDGRRLYDFTGEDRGWVVLSPRDYIAYDGSAQICRLRMQRRDGFNDEYESQGRFPEYFDIWMAEVVEGAPPVPVRVEAETSLGPLRLYLSDHSGGSAARLPARGLIRELETALESSHETRE